MQKDYSNNPRRAHPPAELVSREVIKDAFRIMISITRKSDSF